MKQWGVIKDRKEQHENTNACQMAYLWENKDQTKYDAHWHH